MSHDIAVSALYAVSALMIFDMLLVGALWKLEAGAKLARLR